MKLPPCHAIIKRVWLGLGRGCGLFLGVFTLLNVVGDWRHPGFDATLWWIDLRMLPPAWRAGLLSLFALLCVWFATQRTMSKSVRIAFRFCLVLFIAVCANNAVIVWRLHQTGQIHTAFPVPFSVLMMGLLAFILVATIIPLTGESFRWSQIGFMVCGVCGCGMLFTLGQMVCFGWTDYRRPADLAVVFGCRVYGDGTPSLALHDRVRTAAELYRDGLARRVLLSGGPGDGDVHETVAMQRLAIQFGVAPSDILIDAEGLNTEATVRNSLRLARDRRPFRLLAVSHFYHLPRIKLCYQRAQQDVFTVPAREDRILRGLVRYMAREIVALLWYYVSPAFDSSIS